MPSCFVFVKQQLPKISKTVQSFTVYPEEFLFLHIFAYLEYLAYSIFILAYIVKRNYLECFGNFKQLAQKKLFLVSKKQTYLFFLSKIFLTKF